MLTVFNDSSCHSRKKDRKLEKYLELHLWSFYSKALMEFFLPGKCHILLINDSETLTIITNLYHKTCQKGGKEYFKDISIFERLKTASEYFLNYDYLMHI